MIQIVATTIDEAYIKAAEEFQCSVRELDIQIIQAPSAGFLGMFKKEAIVEVCKVGDKPKKQTAPQERKAKQKQQKQVVAGDINQIAKEVEQKINNLFSQSCFSLDTIKVSALDESTLYIEFGGEDAALLIGKEGYRYKSLSYIIYNWINIKYNLNIKLEIAEFLKNQEENIKNYLGPLIQKIEANGKGQTKVFDGVLVKIALEELRAAFPDKYVGIKTSRDGGRYIVVNNFRK
jgi:spoIIIJ-associated protein